MQLFARFNFIMFPNNNHPSMRSLSTSILPSFFSLVPLLIPSIRVCYALSVCPLFMVSRRQQAIAAVNHCNCLNQNSAVHIGLEVSFYGSASQMDVGLFKIHCEQTIVITSTSRSVRYVGLLPWRNQDTGICKLRQEKMFLLVQFPHKRVEVTGHAISLT